MTEGVYGFALTRLKGRWRRDPLRPSGTSPASRREEKKEALERFWWTVWSTKTVPQLWGCQPSRLKTRCA